MSVPQPDNENHNIIVEIRLLQERFINMDKKMSDFILEMKEYQTKAAHQARQDYEYLDDKIDKRFTQAEIIARDAVKKIDDHILITKTNEGRGRQAAGWVQWIFPTLTGIAALAVAIITIGR